MNKFLTFRFKNLAMGVALLSVAAFISVASANHSWGTFHWARSANPLALKFGDNVSTTWDSYLRTTSSDWNLSPVLATGVVSGKTDPRKCRPTNGRVEVCNSKYGNNGWLGVASIWIVGDHITQGTVKLNDTYFNTPRYNTVAWRQFVACQEIGHTFGLDHQDINFDNPNLGTCMDYTIDPDGTTNGQLSNQHPNQHDYDQLATIYAHLDGFTTISNRSKSTGSANDVDTSDSSEWGQVIRKSEHGRRSVLYERDFDKDQKVFTFVTWADQSTLSK